ncbi:50S ribosomal protein L4 [Venturia nashicola]|uniref:Large ribosomal subunit protein uL4m n=1 Tax=Venturia nashicola TaxID=86259 RepID=A0A4Z1P7Y3_9PEZI|nr:50S ribosomal protein L4 [Venturia nashicola]TLD27822.1 50S ribosomal protein L4 [Venturia nashicola]
MASSTCALPLRSKSLRMATNWSKKCIKESSRRTIHTSDPPISPRGITYHSNIPSHLRPKDILTTLHTFPTLEPTEFLSYSPLLLGVPLRKDILHRAVIYEGDRTRQGTASTKWRSEVHGSNRKIRPQKGSGRARLGDKKSPMLRGGGVAFGPKPRNFATGLPRKVYDAAWRVALSYRYRKGELLVVDSLGIPTEFIDEGKAHVWMQKWMETLGWDRKEKGSVLITRKQTPANESLYQALNQDLKKQGMVRPADGVDVKNVLSMGRIVIEWSALNEILKAHAPEAPIQAAPHLTTRLESKGPVSQETTVDFDQYALDQETEDVEDILKASEEALDDLDDVYDLAEEEMEPPRARA